MSRRWFRWVIPLWAVMGSVTVGLPALAQEFELEDFDFWVEQCRLLSQETDHEKTLEACETAIGLKRKRDNLELWAARSRALFELGQYTEAIGSYNRVLEVAPRESIALTYQCAAYGQLARLDDALAACEQALAINGNWGTDSPALAWYYHGLTLQTMGRLETALSSYGRALRLEPENILARAGQCSVATELGYSNSDGSAYESQGCSLGEAVVAYEQALAQQPDAVTLWFQQGLALEQLGRYDQALTSYVQAVALVEEYALALAHQCAVLNQLDEFEAALAACDAALAGNGKWDRLGPGYAWSQRSAAQIGTGDYEGALASADRAVALLPDYPGGWNNRAVSLWHLEQLEAAKIAIGRAYGHEKEIIEALKTETFDRSYPESPILFHRRRVFTAFNQGSILLDLGSYAEAVEAYQRAVSVLKDRQPTGGALVSDRFLAQLWSNFAIALHATGDRNQFRRAGNYAETSTQYAGDTYKIWYNAGFIQTAVGNYPLALQALTKATELEPDNPDLPIIWYNLGLAAARGYQLPIAWQALQQAAVLTPDNIDIAIKQGEILTQAGCSQTALQLYGLLLNIAPDNFLVIERYRRLMADLGLENPPFIETSTIDVSQCNNIFSPSPNPSSPRDFLPPLPLSIPAPPSSP